MDSYKDSYKIALKAITEIESFALGEEVVTPIGRGIIISLTMPANGLYLSPERADVIVWFSTAESTNGWVQHEFYLRDISKTEENEESKRLKEACAVATTITERIIKEFKGGKGEMCPSCGIHNIIHEYRTEDDICNAPTGLYEIYWISGGSSLAGIGIADDGDRWIAPIDWPSTGLLSNHIGSIKYMMLLQRKLND